MHKNYANLHTFLCSFSLNLCSKTRKKRHKAAFYFLNWSRREDLNPRPADYKSAALPTELHRQTIKVAHSIGKTSLLQAKFTNLTENISLISSRITRHYQKQGQSAEYQARVNYSQLTILSLCTCPTGACN